MKKPKKAKTPEPVKIEDDEIPEASPQRKDGKEENHRMNSVPKQAVNFDDKWIKENIKDATIAHLLQAKREADALGDVVGARKIRRTLRSRGIYVSKLKEDM